MDPEGFTLNRGVFDKNIRVTDDFTLADVVQLCVLEVIEEALEVITPLPLNGIRPKKHIKPNNKLAKQITEDLINNGEVSLLVSGKKMKPEIITVAMLTYEGRDISLEGRIEFTPYDREVHDAVVTLSAAGNTIFTPDMVYRAMNGMAASEKVSPQAIDTVRRSLDKSRFTMLKIDCKQEARAYNKECSAKYEGYLLACDKAIVSIGDRTKEAYRLLAPPVLYEYAKISGQILAVPINLLQTKEAVRSTEDVIVIRGYLIRQIEEMKSPAFKSRNNKIAYAGIYRELRISPDEYRHYNEKTRKIRQHVVKILATWAKHEYIKTYRDYKDGKCIKGVEITLESDLQLEQQSAPRKSVD